MYVIGTRRRGREGRRGRILYFDGGGARRAQAASPSRRELMCWSAAALSAWSTPLPGAELTHTGALGPYPFRNIYSNQLKIVWHRLKVFAVNYLHEWLISVIRLRGFLTLSWQNLPELVFGWKIILLGELFGIKERKENINFWKLKSIILRLGFLARSKKIY